MGKLSYFVLTSILEDLMLHWKEYVYACCGQDLFIEGIKELVRLEEHWLPEEQEISLYIRPFMIATEPRLGVKVSDEYLFCIVCTPMGLYYSEPVCLKVETEFVRAAEGGSRLCQMWRKLRCCILSGTASQNTGI